MRYKSASSAQNIYLVAWGGVGRQQWYKADVSEKNQNQNNNEEKKKAQDLKKKTW